MHRLIALAACVPSMTYGVVLHAPSAEANDGPRWPHGAYFAARKSPRIRKAPASHHSHTEGHRTKGAWTVNSTHKNKLIPAAMSSAANEATGTLPLPPSEPALSKKSLKLRREVKQSGSKLVPPDWSPDLEVGASKLVPPDSGSWSSPMEEATVSTPSKMSAPRANLGGMWIRESTHAGPPKECGASTETLKDEVDLPQCSIEKLSAFHSNSVVFREDPSKLSEVFKNLVFLGENDQMGLSSCMAPGALSYNGSARMIIETQYSNQPRCCNHTEVDYLAREEGAPLSPWAQNNIANMDHGLDEKFSMEYRTVIPSTTVCTASAPCPLVIQMGAFDEPWLLLQSKCEVCNGLLGTMLLNTKLPEVQGQERSDALKTSVLPFIQHFLNKNPNVDRERVYLVGSGPAADAALQAGIMRPDLFSMLVISGKFFVSAETRAIFSDPKAVDPHRLDKSRLQAVRLSVGENDQTPPDAEFFSAIKEMFSSIRARTLNMDLYIYPEGTRTVWWAAWNALHEVIFSAKKDPQQVVGSKITTSCKKPGSPGGASGDFGGPFPGGSPQSGKGNSFSSDRPSGKKGFNKRAVPGALPGAGQNDEKGGWNAFKKASAGPPKAGKKDWN